MYANSQADTLLSQARGTSDTNARDAIYQQFATVLEKDQPAIFLYAPDFLYVVPQTLQGIQLGALTDPAERFLNVYQWYDQTSRIWDVFAPNTTLTQ
jgi:peptide/nickel transport system substrate-binding protein